MEVIVQDANNIVIEVDQGRQGRGISTVGLVTVGADYYLLFTFTDGSTEQVGPIAPIVTEVLFAEARNAEATTILKGQPVYLFQAQGNLATVKLAFNTSDATSAKTLGLAAENIAPGAQGLITCQGTLGGLNTGAYNEGDTLYLGATAGTLTNVKPQAPNHLVYIGVVERANNGAGQIYVRVQNGYELDEIHDVLITNPVNGNTLIYDAATDLWKNAGITAGSGISVTNGASSITVGNTGVLSISGGTTGLTPATATTGAVTLAGTLSTANGGTGLSSFTANRVLYTSSTSAIGQSANLTFDGTNLTAAGSITGSNATTSFVTDATNGFALFTGDPLNYNISRSGTTVSVKSAGQVTLSAGSTSPVKFDIGGSEQMRLTTTGLGIGTSSPTNKLSVFGNANITGNTTLGDASTDTVTVNGYMGVGGAGDASRGLNVISSALTGTSQIGVLSQITATSSATTTVRGFTSNPVIPDLAFTVADVQHYRVNNITKGASATVTNQVGLVVNDLTSATNNYGITSLVSSGTNKWNIYASGTAQNYFGGRVLLGDTDGSMYDTNAGSDVGGYYPAKITGGTGGTSAGVVVGSGTNGTVGFYKGNTAGKDVVTSVVNGQTQVNTAGSEDGRLLFKVMRSGALQDRLAFYEGEAVFNDPGNDYDFRVESDTNTHALFVDAGNSRVGVNNSAPAVELDVAGQVVASTGFYSSAATVSVPNNTATTVLDLTPAAYRNRRLSVSVFDNGTHIGAVADVFVNWNGGTTLYAFTQIYTGSNASALSLSGSNLQLTQTFGSTRSVIVQVTIL